MKQHKVMGSMSIIIGILLMVMGIMIAIISYLPDFKYANLFSFLALVNLFLGGFLFLFGVQMCGKENIQDRYWYIKRIVKMKRQKSLKR